VPIQMVQSGLDRLQKAGELEISVASLGHRSSFVGAVLLTLPGTYLSQTSPPRILLADPAALYKLNQAGSINAWWSDDPGQKFWLEITGRHDVGVDLHCPQRGSDGKRSSGFSLIWWVSPGDIVLHYSLAEDGITSWSRAAGPVTEAPTIWRPHRSATRRRIQQPVPQPGWWLDLDGPFPQPLTAIELTRRQEEIRAILHELEGRHRRSLYFPFFWWPAASSVQCSITSTSFPPSSSASSPSSPRPWNRGLGHLNHRPDRYCSARTTGPHRSAQMPVPGSPSPPTPPLSSAACAGMPIPKTSLPESSAVRA
jgi:hypothetical protein